MDRPFSIIFFFFILLSMFFVVMAFMLNETIMPLSNRIFSGHVIYAHGNMPIHVDIADTEVERQIGLGRRKVMAAGEGMLFKFDEDGKWRVWMKDMKFGIDILWLDKSGTVVDMQEYVYPNTYPNVFEPNHKARYILEVLTGYAGANGITVGHKLDLNW